MHRAMNGLFLKSDLTVLLTLTFFSVGYATTRSVVIL